MILKYIVHENNWTFSFLKSYVPNCVPDSHNANLHANVTFYCLSICHKHTNINEERQSHVNIMAEDSYTIVACGLISLLFCFGKGRK